MGANRDRDDASGGTGIGAQLWRRWSGLDRGWRASFLGLIVVVAVAAL